MDLNAKDLLDQVHRLTTSLVRRYTDIMSRLPLIQQERPQSDKDNEDDFFKPTQINRNRVAVNNLQMEIDAQGLITTAERILTLTQRMKELWLFGTLDTLNQGEPLEDTEEAVKAVAQSLQRLIVQQ